MFPFLKNPDDVFIIAEVGQNHNGNLDIAREYVRVFSQCGADAIKFQSRNNRYLFSEAAYNKTYNSENAFGETYGEHRENLELSREELEILKRECQAYGVRFMCTPFDEPSLEMLMELGIDCFKISSFDLGNIPFINKIAKKNIPIVLSTGGGLTEQIKISVDEVLKFHNKLAILHCVSIYPCAHDELALLEVQTIANKYENLAVGLSDHFNGILSGPIAFMLKARVFEKHVTLNRAQKGTDHAFSLEPKGFSSFVRDIKRTPEMLKLKNLIDLGNEPVFKKLGKSITAAYDLKKGDQLSIENLSGRIFPETYIPVRLTSAVIGKTLKCPVSAGKPIMQDDIS